MISPKSIERDWTHPYNLIALGLMGVLFLCVALGYFNVDRRFSLYVMLADFAVAIIFMCWFYPQEMWADRDRRRAARNPS